MEAVVRLRQDFALVEWREFSDALDLPALLETGLQQRVLRQLLTLTKRHRTRGSSPMHQGRAHEMLDRRFLSVSLCCGTADDAIFLLPDAVLGVAHHLHQ